MSLCCILEIPHKNNALSHWKAQKEKIDFWRKMQWKKSLHRVPRRSDGAHAVSPCTSCSHLQGTQQLTSTEAEASSSARNTLSCSSLCYKPDVCLQGPERVLILVDSTTAQGTALLTVCTHPMHTSAVPYQDMPSQPLLCYTGLVEEQNPACSIHKQPHWPS